MAGKKKSKKKMVDGGAIGMISSPISDQLNSMEFEPNLKNKRSAEQIVNEMKSAETKKTGTSLLAGALSGAAAGSVIPGVGTLIGGVVGLGVAGISRWAGSKDRKEERSNIADDINQQYADTALTESKSRFGYKKGGKVKGAGTSKSDSIDAKIPKGSFLVPAENASIAMEIGQKLLGWKKNEKATIRQNGEEVDLSLNEVLFQPPEVMALESLGIDLNELAPNAGSNRKMVEGGLFERTDGPRAIDDTVYAISGKETFEESLKGRYANSVLAGDKIAEVDIVSEILANKSADPSQATSLVDPTTTTKDSTIPMGTALGGTQILGGVAGLINADKPIMPSISNDLNQLVTETEREAQYGMEPVTRAQAERKIQRNTNRAIEAIGSEFSGGPASRYNRTVDVLNKGNQAVNELAVLNENIMQNKRREARGYKAERGRRTDYLGEFAFKDAREGQMLMGDVVSAGIDNIIGSVEYQKAVEAKKRRDKLDGSLIS